MTDYIRDLRPAKWGSGISLHGSNPLTAHVRFGSITDIEVSGMNVRFTPESGHRGARLACPLCAQTRTSQGPNRLPCWRRRVGDYSRVDAKSCNAILARDRSALLIRQKRSAQSAICWSGMEFLWHSFLAYCKQHKQIHAFPNIPFERMVCS